MNNSENNVKHIDIRADLEHCIRLNEKRLNDEYYQIPNVFSDPEYRSFGDKEGRALWAFLCHYRMTGRENPCLRPMLAMLGEKTNAYGYFGPVYDGSNGILVDEFQFGGHTWFLRALSEGADILKDPSLLIRAKRVFEKLFMPSTGHFSEYPTDHKNLTGDMHGRELRVGEWILCSDICAAFLAIDGLSAYYAASGDERAYTLIKEMAEKFSQIDLVGIRAQTHAVLSTVRGLLRMYRLTEEEYFKEKALKTWELYKSCGMTATFANINWFDRDESWTEPCAVVDSLIVALEMNRLFGNTEDLTLARRIFHNALICNVRSNGGAGTDCIVLDKNPVWHVDAVYEAFFCCTMRLSEGLLTAWENMQLLSVDVPEIPKKDEKGRYMTGDLLWGEIENGTAVGEEKIIDGHRLSPLPKCFLYSEEETKSLRVRVIFK